MEQPVVTEDFFPEPVPDAPAPEEPAAAGVNGASAAASGTADEADAEPGQPPPLLTVLAGLPTAGYPLRRGTTVIGRSSDADLQLKHPEISRLHCRFDWDGRTGCTVTDLGSRWGTKINGAALSAEVVAPLQPGDRLHIGPVQVYYGFTAPPPEAAAVPSEAPSRPQPEDAAPPGTGPKVLIGGREVDVIPLGPRIRFGRSAGDVEVVLADPGISRQHAVVEHTPNGFQVTDLRSRAGSLVNGRRFETHQLVIGDQLQMGPFFFRFDGLALERTSGLAGAEIDARKVRKVAGPITILDDVTLHIDRGQFVAILGPSGSGKSSLLDSLTGLRPAQSGDIRYDGADFYEEYERLRSVLGYVPQDDIVHRELTVAQALGFSAQLRLPAGTPRPEIRKLVVQTIARLGLEFRTHTPIHRLSGGQRKRVSVGVELLGRPTVLFLDEPTSGLDPASEFKMMELLRHLADGGCTVVCTTHVMENVFLTDKLFIIASGKLIFCGGAQDARDHFGVQKLTNLFDRIEERHATEWRADFDKLAAASDAPPGPLPLTPSVIAQRRAAQRPPRPAAALPVLLRRQWTILRADWKNFLILFGQPFIIALLVAWVTDNVSLSLFFAYLGTLWFGCSNAAQEIVREVAIYRRERMVGLGRHSYLLSKFVLLGTLTALQGVFLYACLWGASWYLHPLDLSDPINVVGLERGLAGSPWWEMGSVLCTAYAAVGIGFAISALARNEMQAVMIVPLVLIPQILFSGLVVETVDMHSKVVYALTSIMPSYAAQTMMDVGAFWHRPITIPLHNNRDKAYNHLKDLRARELLAQSPDLKQGDAMGMARESLKVGASPPTVYNAANVGGLAAFKLLAWTLAGYVTAWFGLRAKERG